MGNGAHCFFANVYVLQLTQPRVLSKTLTQNNKDNNEIQ